MRKIWKRIVCSVLTVALLMCVNVMQSEAKTSVYYQLPLNDHDNWHTTVDGNTDNFTSGYLTSPTAFVDYTYEAGVMKIFFTGKSVELKAYQYGSQYGWPTLGYKYEEPIELDLTGVSLEYDITARCGFEFSMTFVNEEGQTAGISLTPMAGLSEIRSNESPHEAVRSTGSINLLEAIKKNYPNAVATLGLTMGNVVKLESIGFLIVNNTLAPNVYNEIHKLRLVKDDTVVSEFEETTWETTVDNNEDNAVNDENETVAEETVGEDVSKKNETTEKTEGSEDKVSDDYVWFFVGGGTVIICACVTLFVLKKKKKAK